MMLRLNLVTTVAVVLIGTLEILVWAGNEHQNQGYFQYANVPAYGQYEYGYNRGNPSHYISRYEQANNWRFRTKVRWGDKYGGYGEHYWDYNHADKGGQHGKGHEQPYGQKPHGHGQVYAPQQLGHGNGQVAHPQQQAAYSEMNPAAVKTQFLRPIHKLQNGV